MTEEQGTIAEVQEVEIERRIKSFEFNVEMGTETLIFQTPPLNGFIERIGIGTLEQVGVKVSLDEDGRLIVLKKLVTPAGDVSHVRQIIQDPHGDMFNYGNAKIAIDGPLFIKVKGRAPNQIKLRVVLS